jgi:hypothetical protein
MVNDILFEVVTPLGFSVRVTRAYWELIVTVKHPVMRGREVDVQTVLQTPEEVRRSRGDPGVLLFYRVEEPGRTKAWQRHPLQWPRHTVASPLNSVH